MVVVRGLVVLDTSRVVGRWHMPECMTEPPPKGQVGNLNPMPVAKGVNTTAI